VESFILLKQCFVVNLNDTRSLYTVHSTSKAACPTTDFGLQNKSKSCLKTYLHSVA